MKTKITSLLLALFLLINPALGFSGPWDSGGSSGEVSDTAYGVSWNGDTTTAPSKNAVYDKVETIVAGGLDFALDSSSSGNIRYVGCSDSIADAITAASAGDTLELGACTYVLSSTLLINKSLTIRGQGVDLTKITSPAESDAIESSDGVDDIRLFDFSVNGSDMNTGIGINISSTQSVTGIVLKNIKVTGTNDGGGTGIYLENVSELYFDNGYVDYYSNNFGTSQLRGIYLAYNSSCSSPATVITRNLYSKVSTDQSSGGSGAQLRGMMQYMGASVCTQPVSIIHLNPNFISDNQAETLNSIQTNGMHAQGGTGDGGLTVRVYNGYLDGGEGALTSNTRNMDIRCDDGSTACYLYNTQLRQNAIQNQGGTATIYRYGGLNFSGGYYGRYEYAANRFVTGAPAFDGIGQTGGNESQAGTRTARAGGKFEFVGGVGGKVESTDAGTKNGGIGGPANLTGGAGGAQDLAAATNVGGVGGLVNLLGGAGGDATNGTSSNTGGRGGSVFLAGGLGGSGATANGEDGTVTVGGTGATTSKGFVQLNMPRKTIAADDTTPDVRYSSSFVTSANTGATAITDLDNPTVGQVILLFGGSNTNSSTIADSGNFNLSGAMTLNTDDMIALYVWADNDYIELFRVNN